MTDLVINFGLTATAIGNLTSAVQFGFILGTLVFALLAIADRFSRVFLVSAMLGALFNAGLMGRQQFDHDALHPISNWFLSCRNLPVGMKIAADFNKGLGKSLGF
jgi:hypothetical protein